jgi:hypothetical protein
MFEYFKIEKEKEEMWNMNHEEIMDTEVARKIETLDDMVTSVDLQKIMGIKRKTPNTMNLMNVLKNRSQVKKIHNLL